MARWALLLVMVWGCGGSDGGLSLENFPERSIQNFCENAAACGAFPDVATCVETQNDLALDQALADEDAGLLNPDGDLLAECARVEQSCDQEFNTTEEEKQRAIACIQAVSGELEDGEVCTSSFQCAGAFCARAETCDPSDACCAGTCDTGTLPFSQNGEDCLFGPSCDVGLFCSVEISGQDVMLVCRPQVAPGAECLRGNACTEGHWCNSPDGESAGTCEPRSAPGESCDGASVTRASACIDTTTYCDGDTSFCEPRPEEGESCSEEIPCLGYAFCDSGTCRTRPTEGEACDSENGPRCLGQLSCLESGVCGFDDGPAAEICEI